MKSLNTPPQRRVSSLFRSTSSHCVAYVGTYPPKECGIATYTMDVVNATDLSGWRSVVFAVDDEANADLYTDPKVGFIIEKENPQFLPGSGAANAGAGRQSSQHPA